MSRFWAAGGGGGGSSSSDNGSGDDDADDRRRRSDNSGSSGADSDDESGGGGGGGLGQAGQQEANRWLAMSDDDSSDEDSVRVVKSGKERFQESVQSAIVGLKKAMRARDYYEIQTLFDSLAKNMIKNKQYLVTGVPRPLVRLLCELEDYAVERLLDKAQFKTLSARQGRALNRMKLTFKKHNRAYQTVMVAYRANPVVSDNEDDEEDDDNHDDDKDAESADSSDSDSDSDSSSSDSDSEVKGEKKKKTNKGGDDDSVRGIYPYFSYLPVLHCSLHLIFVLRRCALRPTGRRLGQWDGGRQGQGR